jgi:gliding motility-associated-like protein
MKKSQVFILFGLLIPFGSAAQSILNASGGTAVVKGYVVDYSISELTLVQTYASVNTMLTQGLLQPFTSLITPLDIDINPDVSPNDDGLGHDVFTIDGIGNYPNNRMRIYDRWGSLIFEIAGYNNTDRAFKGKANTGLLIDNKEAADGTYFYVLEIYNAPTPPATRVYNGFLVLKRK